MTGGGEYTWIRTDTGYIWSGPGIPPGCGPGCCGGCKTQPGQRLFGFPVEDHVEALLQEGKELGDIYREKFNRMSYRPHPDILSNYVTKQELENALNKVLGVCGDSIDKENSAKCNKSKGHIGFCDRL